MVSREGMKGGWVARRFDQLITRAPDMATTGGEWFRLHYLLRSMARDQTDETSRHRLTKKKSIVRRRGGARAKAPWVSHDVMMTVKKLCGGAGDGLSKEQSEGKKRGG